MKQKKLCFNCNSEMVEKEMPIATGWGSVEFTVNGLTGFECTNCKEIVFLTEVAELLEALGRSMAESRRQVP